MAEKVLQKLFIFYSFVNFFNKFTKQQILMRNCNDIQDIQLFSYLIETILTCRLRSQNNIYQQLTAIIAKFQTIASDDRYNLNVGLKIISKLHKHSQFKVNKMLEKHFSTHNANKYEIYLQILEFNHQSKQQIFAQKYQKPKVLEKWIFKKQQANTINNSQFPYEFKGNDVIQKALCFLLEQNMQKEQRNYQNRQIINNTTLQKGYQFVIKSKCSRNQKNMLTVLHHESINTQAYTPGKNISFSLLQLPKYWQKSIRDKDSTLISVGCYFQHASKSQMNFYMQTNSIEALEHPDRKLSSQTKAQQKQKESTSSFKLSFQNFSFRLSGKKPQKRVQDIYSNRRSTQQPIRHHRPRFQSIYQSKDQQMNIFILSPRKLSGQESPKIKNFEQKTIEFQIPDNKYGFSQEIIEEFSLEPEDNASNSSSDGFQMLEDNDRLDSIREERTKKELQQQSPKSGNKRRFFTDKIEAIQRQMVQLLKALDKLKFY